MLALESRAKYVIAWRGFQRQDFEPRSPGLVKWLKLYAVLAYTLFVRPRNLIYSRDTDYQDIEKAWLNGRLIMKLNVIVDVAQSLEFVFWLCFVAALSLLIIGTTT